MNTEKKKDAGQGSFRARKNLKIRQILIVSIIVCVVYCGMLLIEGLFKGGDFRAALISLMACSFLMACFTILAAVFPHEFYLPLIMGTMAQIVFIAVGSYLQELEFYFLVMLLLLGIISILKNFRLLVVMVIIMIFNNILILIFLVPRLEWVNHYRFIMQFVFSLYCSAFMLIISRYVEQKSTRGDQALLSLSSLLRATPNYTVITDASYKVRYISESMLKFTNALRREFAVGQPLVDLFDDKKLKFMFSEVINVGGLFESVTKIEMNGEERYFKIISDKLSDEYGGKFIDIVDITAIEKSRIAAEEAQTRAEIANFSKSRFLTTMSHEIRTPMNAIIGISEIELDRENASPGTRDAFSRIYNSGYLLLGIINDILDLSKIETGKLELIPVKYNTASLLSDTIQLNMMRIGSKPIDFVFTVSENLPLELFGDDLRIKQILNNLLSNAIKYTESGVVAFNVDSRNEKDAVRLLLTIRDTGQGIAREQLKELFDAYSQFNREANRRIEGTGLGMSITKNLIDMMNGSIMVESKRGVGSVFTVDLIQQPAGSAVIGRELADNLQNFLFLNKSQMSHAQVVREYMPYGSVLIVDDLETNLFVAKGLMLPYGLNIDSVSSGFTAIEKIRKGAVYDIVFMDHMMPDMDGIEATKLIRQEGYSNPIVALTANAIVGQAEIFFSNGFDDFISKPIDIRQLDAVLKKMIRDRKPPEVVEEARRIKSLKDADSEDSASEDEIHSIPEIPGVDIKYGVAMTGGTAAGYLTVLSIFRKDAEERLSRLKAPLDAETMPVFVTQVHALKSASASIGAAGVSEFAAKLEAAGKAENLTFIRENLGGFIDLLAELEKNVGAVLKEKEAAEEKCIPSPSRITDSQYLSFFGGLIEALKSGNLQDIDRLLDELNMKPLDSKTQKIVEQISDHVLVAEYDSAVQTIYEFVAKNK